MPEEPIDSVPSQAQKRDRLWLALGIAVAVLIGTSLASGQVWGFTERLRDDWRRWSSMYWPETAALGKPHGLIHGTPILFDPREPGEYQAEMRKGMQLYEVGSYSPAMGRFRRAAATAYLWMGRSAFRTGRRAEARIALERAIALGRDSETGKEARALLYRLMMIRRKHS